MKVASTHELENEPESWVVWNASLGVVVTASLGRVEIEPTGNRREAWLAPPYDVVGPFSLDQLEAAGYIVFGACVVMSRQKWQQDQVRLRREAHAQRHKHARSRNHGSRRGLAHRVSDERRHRETLKLPAEGTLEVKQIKAAFRRVALRAHPDGGGSHELFLRVTDARDALLELRG